MKTQINSLKEGKTFNAFEIKIFLMRSRMQGIKIKY